ncbi:hypothetical protein OG361_22900 [Streptomyces sp. NBC_00090]|uniref:hypothetical protein n=1 Tax=Streptomyces sp. NBC_00090 TaxID=2903619 RepID=UPI0032487E65
MNAVGHDGYEQHPLLHKRVRDIASRGEGELTAVTHELHTDGRVVRVAHIRPKNGIEWTTSADNVQAALQPAGLPALPPAESPARAAEQ